jgi:cell shape-determining protein MreD
MMVIKEIGRLLLLFALQVLLFDHLHVGHWGIAMVYILFLLNLPVRIPRWAEMLIGLVVGLIMDIWHSSLGIHIAACVALSFARPLLLNQAVQDVERIKDNMSFQTIGRIEYTKCVVILTILHHFIVFTLESWNLAFWWIILLQTIVSSIMTLCFILGHEYLKR